MDNCWKKHEVPEEVKKRWVTNTANNLNAANVALHSDSTVRQVEHPVSTLLANCTPKHQLTHDLNEQLLRLLPTSSKEPSKANIVEHASESTSFTSLSSISPATQWLIDSGVTNHMTCRRDLLFDVSDSPQTNRVILPT